mmetsp:Transcript_21068/g.39360  ORF Transcript_21068/g.39360 Transcript_21068/m.39360 type:complete len:184 (+) Transcript_21068:185-736(+)
MKLPLPCAFLILLSIVPSCMGQFGMLNNKNQPPREDDIDATSREDMQKYMLVAAKLQAAAPIPSQDAVDLAAVLDALLHDPETKKMVENLQKADGRKASLEAFSDSLTQKEIVESLKQTLDELKALEYLFQDPARAVLEMHKDGMVPENRLKFYKKNPEQLEEDTRKGLYFSFVSLAVAGGFL